MKTAIFSQVKVLVKTDNDTFTLNAYQTVYLPDNFTFVEFIAQNFQDGCYFKDKDFSKNIKIYTVLDIRLIIFDPHQTRSHSHAEFFRQNYEAGYKRFEVCNYLDGAYKLNVYDEKNSQNIELPFKATKTKVMFKNGFLIVILSGVRSILFIFDPVNIDLLLKKVCDNIEMDENITITIEHFTNLHHLEKLVICLDKGVKILSRTVIEQKVNCHPYLIGVNFLETIMVKGDINQYLDGDIKDNQNEIFEFFGNFKQIIYLNNLGYDNMLGLLYSDCIKVFSPVISNGKIVDFSLQ